MYHGALLHPRAEASAPAPISPTRCALRIFPSSNALILHYQFMPTLTSPSMNQPPRASGRPRADFLALLVLCRRQYGSCHLQPAPRKPVRILDISLKVLARLRTGHPDDTGVFRQKKPQRVTAGVLSMWWRRGELNPRPQIRHLWRYMLSRSIWF